MDAVALDQAVVIQVHCLDEIHLFAFSTIPQIPDQSLAVRQVTSPKQVSKSNPRIQTG
jgi:hypothetical protein